MSYFDSEAARDWAQGVNGKSIHCIDSRIRAIPVEKSLSVIDICV